MVARERNIWDELEGIDPPQDSVADTFEQPNTVSKGFFGGKKKPPIPKNWNAIVLKPIYGYVLRDGKKVRDIVDTEGWFEYVAEPQGRPKTYIESQIWGDSKRSVFVLAEDENGENQAFIPPEFIVNLPEALHRARKGCPAYSRFLAWRNSLVEKIKVFLMFGIMAMLAFLTFLIINPKG